MSAPHTPGTWRAVGCDGSRWWRVVTDFDGHWDADLAQIEIGGLPGEAGANARLMAAAPDLLAACKSLWGYLYATHNPAELPAFCREAEAAIAKAEGREP